jgi:hypothetical protein
MGWDRMGWDRMRRDGMRWDGMGLLWEGTGFDAMIGGGNDSKHRKG